MEIIIAGNVITPFHVKIGSLKFERVHTYRLGPLPVGLLLNCGCYFYQGCDNWRMGKNDSGPERRYVRMISRR